MTPLQVSPKILSLSMAASLLLFTLLSLLRPASSDVAADQAECGDKLIGLATCLPYVQGTAKAPTPDCCSGLKTVLSTSPKCLCVLIKDRNSPDFGIQLNATLALGLPSTCSIPANISDCPRLLKLPPNSTDALIFKQFGRQEAGKSGSVGGGDKGNSTGNKITSTSNGKRRIHLWQEWAIMNIMVMVVVPLLMFLNS